MSGTSLKRVILAAVLIAGGLVLAPVSRAPAGADPANCPPACDRVPATAWIDPSVIPLDSVYRWPGPAGIAVTAPAPRFRFEELCATPWDPQEDPRDYSVAGQALVGQPPGHWQLQVQVMHWRGETWLGGQLADTVFRSAIAALRDCQLTAPSQSPSITVDEPNRMAAVVSGPVILHQYLVAHPSSSTISALALWSTSPPQEPWPVIADAAVLDAMTAPLCVAYISSCQ